MRQDRHPRHGRGEPGADGGAVGGQPPQVGADALQRRVPVARLRQHVLVRRKDVLHLRPPETAAPLSNKRCSTGHELAQWPGRMA